MKQSYCSTCETPLLVAYCGRHNPSAVVRGLLKLRSLKTNVKLFFTGYISYDTNSDSDMRDLDGFGK